MLQSVYRLQVPRILWAAISSVPQLPDPCRTTPVLRVTPRRQTSSSSCLLIG